MNGYRARRARFALAAAAFLLVALACVCGPLQQAQEIQSTVGSAQSTIGPALTDFKQNAPTYEAAATQLQQALTAAGPGGSAGDLGAVLAGGETRQWAANAGGSTQASTGDHSFSQITGIPNTPGCGDYNSAWASDPAEMTPILTAEFATAVIPTKLIIHHTYNPGAVAEVNVGDGGVYTAIVYKGSPFTIAECPFQQVIDIPVGNVLLPISEVVISFNQTGMGGQDQIDAIELIGIAKQ